MPDFFDRLVARGSPDGTAPGSDAGAAGAPSYLENRAGIVRARPRLPGPFERPARPWPDDMLEITETPAPPGARAPEGTPIHPAAPAAAPWPGFQAQVRLPPVTYRAGARVPEPDGIPAPSARPAIPLPAAPAPALSRPATPSPVPEPAAGLTPSRPGGGSGYGPPAPAAAAAPQAPLPLIVAAARPAPAPPGDGQRPGPGQDRAAPPPGRTGPAVQVRIGRIDVQAAPDRGRRAAGRAPARPAPVVSLDRFLAREAPGEGGAR